VSALGPVARPSRWVRASLVVESLALVALVVLSLGRSAKRVPTHPSALLASPAGELRARGLMPGSRVGIVGSPYGHYWAHQDGLRLAVVTTTEGRHAPVSDAELSAIASEACAHGTSLAAIVGEHVEDVQSPQAIRLTSGLWLWRPTSPCSRFSTR
jgi:hypothetical protein